MVNKRLLAFSCKTKSLLSSKFERECFLLVGKTRKKKCFCLVLFIAIYPKKNKGEAEKKLSLSNTHSDTVEVQM